MKNGKDINHLIREALLRRKEGRPEVMLPEGFEDKVMEQIKAMPQLTPKTDTYEQTDYVNLAIRSKEMRFHYRARIDNTPMPWEQRQDVADAVDQMLNEYINRTDVIKKGCPF